MPKQEKVQNQEITYRNYRYKTLGEKMFRKGTQGTRGLQIQGKQETGASNQDRAESVTNKEMRVKTRHESKQEHMVTFQRRH